VTVVTLKHPAHRPYLNVYNSAGGHAGYNSALLNSSKTAIEVIPGTYYLDYGNGTAFIVLPSSMQSFKVVVDGTEMEEASESYSLTYTVIQNGTVTSTKTVQGTISNGTLQSTNVTIQNGVLAIGGATVTTSTTTTTSSSTTSTKSSATSATSSSTSTSSSSSTSSGSNGSSDMTYLVVGVIVVVIIALTIAVLARRRAEKWARYAAVGESVFPLQTSEQLEVHASAC
jgi:hypothetical protein